MGTTEKQTYEEFESRHSNQLIASGVPKHFWHRLHQKLDQQLFDAGDFFQIFEEVTEDGEHNYSVVALTKMEASDANNIFLIDHAWTFRPQCARDQLHEIPGLLDRMCTVFNIENKNRSIESFSDYGGSGDEGVSPMQSGSGTRDSGIGPPMRPSSSVERKMSMKIRADPPNNPQGGEQPPESPAESSTTSPMCGSMTTESEEERRVNEVLKQMWRVIHTYTMRFADREPEECDMPLWYMPDEFGIRICHSETPNCRMVPIFYTPENVAYSVLFPVRDIDEEEHITRNFIDTKVAKLHPEWRHVLMHPWTEIDLSGEKLEHIIAPNDHFTRGRIPDLVPKDAGERVPDIDANCLKLRVLTDNKDLFNRLKSLKIEYVDRIEDADIVWLRKHFNDYASLREKNPKALVNQFPCECVLTVKDLLAATIQSINKDSVIDPRTMKWPPSWFETTFNLETELPQFVAYYQQQALKKMDNIWIIKPWNLARGLDMHVTDNLSYIIRLIESGPKIACKYIHQPVLFRRPDNGNMVKFDLRYIAFLRGVKPLDLHLYKQFWVRFAINDFSLSELDNRETHFTVFNYADSNKVLNMKCEDFIKQFEQLHAIKWSDIQPQINDVIKEVMQTVSTEGAPRGIVANGQSRAMYGLDIMLKWDSDNEATRKVCVSFIEGNFMPDCERACKFDDDFADTAVRSLFVDGGYQSDKLIKL